MHRWRALQARLGWMTLLVFGLVLLAPTVSRALAAQRMGNVPGGVASASGSIWIEICTSAGPAQWLNLSTGELAAQPPDGLQSAHSGSASNPLSACGLCDLHTDRLAPPPVKTVLRHVFTREFTPVFVATEWPVRHLPWQPPPRGPPCA